MDFLKQLLLALVRIFSVSIARTLGRKGKEASEREDQRKREETRRIQQKKTETFTTGIRFARTKQYKEALEKFQEAIKFGANSDSCKYNMGVCYTHLGEYENAIKHLENTLSIKGARETLTTAYINSGIHNQDRERFLLNMRDVNSYNIGTKEDIINMINVITIELSNYYTINFDKLDDIRISVIVDALDLDCLNQEYMITICKYYFQHKQYDVALDYCKKAYEAFKNKEIIEIYVKILKELGNESSLILYEEYIQAFPEDAEMRLYIIKLLMKHRNFEQVVNVCKLGIDIDKNNSYLRIYLINAYMYTDNIDNAILEIQALINEQRFDSNITESHVRGLLGACFMKKKMYRIALKQFIACSEKIKVIEKLYNLGEIFQNQSDLESANICWEEIYSVDATYKDVISKLA
ncbi:tetratricopeptide repeat protein [Clostridium sp.]|uniref:tetratricopeptide repeat protein n=1 Tax=Clostridium sp. TaxID=1506 RepID=UPI003D6CA46D